MMILKEAGEIVKLLPESSDIMPNTFSFVSFFSNKNQSSCNVVIGYIHIKDTTTLLCNIE